MIRFESTNPVEWSLKGVVHGRRMYIKITPCRSPYIKSLSPLQISPYIGWFSTTGKVSVTIDQPKQYLPGTPRQRGPLHRYTAVEYGIGF